MNPGKLDRRVVIQVRVFSKDATGSRVETWSDHATVWAELVTAKAKPNEVQIADADRATEVQQFRMRYRTITSTGYRLLYRSKFFNITGITEERRQASLLLDTVTYQSLS